MSVANLALSALLSPTSSATWRDPGGMRRMSCAMCRKSRLVDSASMLHSPHLTEAAAVSEQARVSEPPHASRWRRLSI